jgi:hypothetical protein
LDVTGKRRSAVPLTVDAGTVVLKMQPEYQTVCDELSAKQVRTIGMTPC